MRSTYKSDILTLYVAYFSGSTKGPIEVGGTIALTGGGGMGYTQALVDASPAVVALPRYGPSAKDARRAQIKRNGGRR